MIVLRFALPESGLTAKQWITEQQIITETKGEERWQ
jgi:hypothetical protein